MQLHASYSSRFMPAVSPRLTLFAGQLGGNHAASLALRDRIHSLAALIPDGVDLMSKLEYAIVPGQGL